MRRSGRSSPARAGLSAEAWSATIEKGDVPHRVLLRADQALYDVKGRGRDGVAVAPPPLPPARGVPGD